MKSASPIIRSDIHGVRIDIEVDDPEVHGWLSEYLAPYIIDSGAEASIKFVLGVRPEKPMVIPEEAEWFLHYEELAGRTYKGVFYFGVLGSVMRFDPARNLVEGTLTDPLLEQRRYITHIFFTVVLFETLRYHGLYYIHSAALVSPSGGRLLIPANGASGKTTLCVALLYHGFNYVSDDAVFANRKDGKIELVPFIRKFHVSPRLTQIFDELKFLENEPKYFPGNDKREFTCEDVFPGRFNASMGLPDVILFPEIVDEHISTLTPMTDNQALTRMIPNSALVMFSKYAAKSHLMALKEIVSSARCYELRSGRDVYDDPREATGRILEQLKL